MVSIVLEIIGGAVVVEVAMQAAWHLGARRFWRPDPPRCPEVMKFTTNAQRRCRFLEGHDDPLHEFYFGGETYYRPVKAGKDPPA